MVSKAKARTRAQAQASAPTRLNVAQAFIRIRPLLSHELAAGETVLPGLVVEGNCPLRPEEEQTAGTMTTTNVGVNALNSKTTPIGGFTGVLGHHDDNIAVFERTFLPRIATVLRGGTASLFCYGYTGAGKTHTVFGYEGEPGMYALAADEIITLLDEWNDAHPSREPVMLQIRCAEVYNEDVFDLLNGRSKCSLRKDSTGKLMVRGGTKKKVLTEAESKSWVESNSSYKLKASMLSWSARQRIWPMCTHYALRTAPSGARRLTTCPLDLMRYSEWML